MSDTKVKLTEEQMIEILKNKKINQCSKEERDQVMDFAFGSDFMESDNKGEKVKITNKPEVKFLVTWNEEAYSDTKPRIVTMSEFVDDGIGGNWNIEEDGEDTDLGFTIENLKNLKVGETHTVYSPFGWDIKITKESDKPEEVFTQSTIVYFDRYDFDLKGYGYRINGEFVEIHQSELPRLKEKLGDDVFNSAMQVGKDYGVDTIIFTEDDFEENANPWTLAYEKFCGESE